MKHDVSISTMLTVGTVALCFFGTGHTPAAPRGDVAVDAPPAAMALRQERLATLRKAREIAERQYASGMASLEQIEHVDQQLVEAELALATLPQQRADILSKAAKEAEKQEAVTQQRVTAGTATAFESLEAKAYRLGLQIRLSEAGADQVRNP